MKFDIEDGHNFGCWQTPAGGLLPAKTSHVAAGLPGGGMISSQNHPISAHVTEENVLVLKCQSHLHLRGRASLAQTRQLLIAEQQQIPQNMALQVPRRIEAAKQGLVLMQRLQAELSRAGAKRGFRREEIATETFKKQLSSNVSKLPSGLMMCKIGDSSAGVVLRISIPLIEEQRWEGSAQPFQPATLQASGTLRRATMLH